MGYEKSLFIDVIDDEFVCSICSLVVKNPVHSLACEHLFCFACIKGWLTLEHICPVDRMPLKLEELRPPGRLIQRLLNKLMVKCNFYPDGCRTVVKFEDLEIHVGSCNYNYEAQNVGSTCLSNYSISNEEYDCTKLINEVVLQPLKHMDVINSHKNIQAPWQVFHNMKECIGESDQTNILECGSKSCYAFAQSSSSLSARNSSFKIEIVNLDRMKYVAIGVTSKGHKIDKIPGLHMDSIGYDSVGDVISSSKSKKIGLRWKVGDIIECGIKFPISNDGSTGAIIYFLRNRQLISENGMGITNDGYFPTLYMYEGVVGSNGWSSDTKAKVKYFTN